MFFVGFLILSSHWNTSYAADQPKRPNILFALADDWGYHASVLGTRWVSTPAFDRVAKSGLLFTHAYTPTAKCAPSRSAILTGRNPWQLKEAANHICYFPPEFKSFCEALTEQGWNVGHTQKGWGPGTALDANGKPRQMTGKGYNKRKTQPPTSAMSSNDYAGNFEEFLNDAEKDKPWFFWYGSIEPHRAYEYGSGVAKGGKKLSDIDHVPGYWPDNETVRNDLLDYAFEVEYFDHHLGRMLELLEKKGLLENTLIVVTSDNGMPFPRSKGNAQEVANHLPLAISWKNGIVNPGRRVSEFVSFIDLAPTFIDVAGLNWKEIGMSSATGQSLLSILQDKPAATTPGVAVRDRVIIGRERNDIGRPNDQGFPVRGIINEKYAYVRNFEPTRWPSGNPETGYLDTDAGATKTNIIAAHRKEPADKFWQLCFGKRDAEELYDLASDPDCLHNLVADAKHISVLGALREQLRAELQQQQDPRITGNGDVFDQYQHANKGHVGFYERFMKGEKIPTPWVLDSDREPANK